MNKIDSKLASDVYGCFRCGDTLGPMIVQTDGYVRCGGCNEVSVVTFQQALDILNNMWIEGNIRHYEEYSTEDSLEDVIDD